MGLSDKASIGSLPRNHLYAMIMGLLKYGAWAIRRGDFLAHPRFEAWEDELALVLLLLEYSSLQTQTSLSRLGRSL